LSVAPSPYPAGPDPIDLALVGQRLWFVALALFLYYGAAVLSVALPPLPLDPRWQLPVIAALLGNGPLALIGLALTHLAVVLQPANRRMRHRSKRIGQLAVVAAIGFLLLLPLQVSATWRVFQARANSANRQQLQGQQTITALRQAITAASSNQDLQRRLEALNLPVAGQADLQIPFPQRQQKLLAGLQQSQERLAATPPVTPPLPLGALLQSGLRVTPAALALAWAFWALGNWRRGPGGRKPFTDASYFEVLSARKPL
jgi:hypothetical protein